MADATTDDRVLFGLVIPTMVGLLVAGWNLGLKPLSYDETFEALLVMHPPIRFAGWVVTFEASGAFYHSVLWLWKFIGTSEAVLRLPSVVFAVAAIPVTFVIARRMMIVPWATLAAFLLGRLWFLGIPSGTDDETELRAVAEIERQFLIERDFNVPGLVVRLYVRPSG